MLQFNIKMSKSFSMFFSFCNLNCNIILRTILFLPLKKAFKLNADRYEKFNRAFQLEDKLGWLLTW